MSDELFHLIYYSPLFLFLNIGVIAVLVGNSHFLKSDFSIEEWKLAIIKSKKGMIRYFMLMLLLPTTIIPIYIFIPDFFLVIRFFILFFTITFFYVLRHFFKGFC